MLELFHDLLRLLCPLGLLGLSYRLTRPVIGLPNEPSPWRKQRWLISTVALSLYLLLIAQTLALWAVCLWLLINLKPLTWQLPKAPRLVVQRRGREAAVHLRHLSAPIHRDHYRDLRSLIALLPTLGVSVLTLTSPMLHQDDKGHRRRYLEQLGIRIESHTTRGGRNLGYVLVLGFYKYVLRAKSLANTPLTPRVTWTLHLPH